MIECSDNQLHMHTKWRPYYKGCVHSFSSSSVCITVSLHASAEYITSCISIQWVPDYLNLDYLNSRLSERLDIAMFSTAAGKRRSSHWSSATGESKTAVWTTFPSCYKKQLFQPVWDLDHDLQRPSSLTCNPQHNDAHVWRWTYTVARHG